MFIFEGIESPSPLRCFPFLGVSYRLMGFWVLGNPRYYLAYILHNVDEEIKVHSNKEKENRELSTILNQICAGHYVILHVHYLFLNFKLTLILYMDIY